MTLQTRLTALTQAVGADIKTLNGKVATVQNASPVQYGYETLAVGSVAIGNIAWKTVPVPAGGKMDPSSGAFVENVDGSVTVVNAGWYTVSAVGSVTENVLKSIAFSDTPDSFQPTGWPSTSSPAMGTDSFLSVAGSIYLAAGTKLYVNMFAATAFHARLQSLSIVRNGSGPAGPSGQSAGKIFYQAPSDPSDIAGYKTLLVSPSVGAEQTIASVCAGTADVLVASFATDPGVPGVVDYPAGTAYRRIYAMVSAGVARLHLQIFKRDAAGAETLVRDEYSDPFNDTAVTGQMWTSSLPSAGALLATDRLVAKLYAQRISGPTNITVTTYYEGTTHASQIQTTISTGAQGPIGPQGPAGPAGAVGGNATVPMDTWHTVNAAGEPAFLNNWANTSASAPAKFRKFPDGKVKLAGHIKTGFFGTVAFILPAAYCPAQDMIVPAAYENIGGSQTAAEVRIATTGHVTPNATSTGTAPGIYLSLDGLEFDTETVTAIPTGPQGPQGPAGPAGAAGAAGAPGGNATVPMDTWHLVGAAGEPAFQTGWVNYGGGYGSARFRKYPDGRVKLAGLVRAGTGIIFTLPAGYKPPGVILAYTTVDAGGVGQVSINANGDVQAGALSGTTTNVFLDGIEFDTETVTQVTVGPQGPKGDPGAAGGNATVPMDTWHRIGAAGEPTFFNSWAHYGAPYSQVAFQKNPLGRVRLRGMALQASVINIQAGAFILPTGYIPPAQCYFTCPANTASGVIKVMIATTGVVYFDPVNPGTWVDVSEIEFDTETVTQMPTGPTGVPGGQALTKLIGDGTATSFIVAHNFNQANVGVSVYRTASPYDEIVCDVEHTDANTITVRTFPTVPASNEYTVSVSAAGTNALAAVTMDVWHTVGGGGEPAFQNSWVNYDAYRPAKFRKFPDGVVRLSGIVKTGSVPSTIFTLPAGYRPPNLSGTQRVFAGDANNAHAEIFVYDDGRVWVQSGSNAYVSLDGISFDTETVLQTASMAAVPMDTWHTVGGGGSEPAFASGWANWGSGLSNAGFRKYPDGRVALKGVLWATAAQSANATIFTLPVGYRPAADLILDQGSSSGAIGITIVASTGVVRVNSALIINSQVWFDGATFDTETVSAYVAGAVNQSYACTITGTASISAQGAGALAKMVMNTVVLDNMGWWDTVNARYIPKVAGRYLATAAFVAGVAGTGSGSADLAVTKNGTVSPVQGYMRAPIPASPYGMDFSVTGQFVMNGSTDYLEVFGGAASAMTGQDRLDICYLGAV